MVSEEVSSSVRVAIVDAHRMLLDGVASWIATAAADIEVVIGVRTWGDLVEHPAFPVDVVLLDLNIADGTSALARIAALRSDGVASVVLSSAVSLARVRACLAAGASAFVPKTEPAAEILEAIRAAAQGRHYLPAALREEATGKLLDARGITSGAQEPPGVRLSAQEERALVLYASDLPLKTVARLIGVSQDTVKTYLGRVKDKYTRAGRPTSTKIDLRRRAIEDGLLPGDEGSGASE